MKMKADVRTFRILIIVAMALAFLGPLFDLFFPELIPKPLIEARGAYEDSQEWSLTEIIVTLAFALAGLVLAIVATIGLYQLKPWGRKASLWIAVAAPFFYPLVGPTLESGLATACNSASSTIWGAVLSMAYFSDLKIHFDKA